MIIGLTGKNGSGKGEVAAYLKERSFELASLSDALRDELKRRGLASSRENLIAVGNELRARYGPGVLAERILAALAEHRHHVVDSIRNPGEVEVLRRRPDFKLLCVRAPLALRFQRSQARGRLGDGATLEAFARLEEEELDRGAPERQRLDRVEELADAVIENDGTLEQLHQRLGELLRGWLTGFTRPGWDEYFMRIAQVVASRSNCLKRRVAAVIVRDRRIISTGYNGTPRGVRNCSEGGCPRCGSAAPAGTALEECLCSHGEENAITQAAYHGISLKGATLYSTFAPCLMCTKMIINAGIAEVIYNEEYPLNQTALALLEEAGVVVRCYKLEAASRGG